MKLIRLLPLAISMSALLSGCGLQLPGFRHDVLGTSDWKVSSSPVETTAVQSCPEQSLGTQILGVSRHAEITVHKTFQHEVDYDCEGKVTSDGFVTTQEAKQHVRFEPLKGDSFHRVALSITNRNTCSHATDWSPFDNPSMHFITVNVSDVFFANQLYVNRDVVNYADYEFLSCEPLKDGASCTPDKSFEKGTVVFNINYSENYINDPNAVRPTDCSQK